MKKRIDIRDVAREAKVSVATVSRVFSKPDIVSGNTAKRVREAATKLEYFPNSAASNLRTAKSKRVAVLVPDISNPFFSMVIRGINKKARDVGYTVLLADTQGDPLIETRYAELYFSRQIDGVIQLSARAPITDNIADSASTLPWVNACECVTDESVSRVMVNNRVGMEQMTKFVLSKGHKHIAVISGPQTSPLTRERLSGVKDTLHANALELAPSDILVGDFSLKSGWHAAGEILEMKNRPTAVICFNDEMAIGAMNQFVSAGISVPQDISVSGFDDIPTAQYAIPKLTTAAQPCSELGQLAMVELLSVIENPAPKRQTHVLPIELKIRDSVGPAP